MPDAREHNSLTQSILNVFQGHSRRLENLHRLPAKESVFDTINLGKGSFAQKALDLVGVANVRPLG
jgi:hypothetical protein